MSNLYWTCAFIFVALLVYRFREVWLGALRRFDERNVERLEQEQRDKTDPIAHFRHTLTVAGEQVEEVQEIVEPDERTGDPVTRYLFNAEKFATREEAEEARNIVVVAKARIFYRHLPAALTARRSDDKLN
ncbi:MAG TPA: hypothetical protein VMD53_03445 [Rhizomicrobium sp.]|nr:hypothetical protein [Rhizomicrobium sp.]